VGQGVAVAERRDGKTVKQVEDVKAQRLGHRPLGEPLSQFGHLPTFTTGRSPARQRHP
jgi:hypothetical protein